MKARLSTNKIPKPKKPSRRQKKMGLGMPQVEENPFQKQWEDYRKRQFIFRSVFIALVPCSVLISFFLGNLLKRSVSAENFTAIVFIVLIVILGIYGVKLSEWQCPRCGKSFAGNDLLKNLLASRCMNCRMPKYTGSTFQKDRRWVK